DSVTSGTYPIQVGIDYNWVAIAAGYEFSLGLKSDGSLWSWGFNGNGQLGTGSTNHENFPVQVGQDTDWEKIEAGSTFSFGIKTDSSLWAWGYNEVGQLGDGSMVQQTSPIDVDFGYDWKCIAAASGVYYAGGVYGHHSLGIKGDASVICATGANYIGQLGDGTIDNHEKFFCTTAPLLNIPFQVTENSGPFVQISPNPNNGTFTLNIEGDNNQLEIELFNSLGQLILIDEVINNTEIRLSGLSKGIYLLNIKSKDQIFSKKIIIK
ncbi:MAG: T9SS type A sorting domain-containing protein, partial [Bacteroidota bacterium]|nr:T9SS type A sorting domain-containing protein [Bacteroidota bacterium]